MPRLVSSSERLQIIRMMLDKDDSGEYIYTQREIEKETGMSRPYIRKLAREFGHQFPRNGIEVQGNIYMCTNCGCLFRRSKSRAIRARHQFCDEECKIAWMKGPQHPAWKKGKTASTFSQWIKNQSGYIKWREQVLDRDERKCRISGKTDNLEVHHILPKAEGYFPEKALSVDNGITLNTDVHDEIHELIREGVDYEEAIERLRQKYQGEENA
jgi:hypothetical protein